MGSSLDEEASMTKMQDMIDDEDNSKIDQDDQQQISAQRAQPLKNGRAGTA